MNANLMRATRIQGQPNATKMFVVAPLDRGLRDGDPTITADAHFLTVSGMPANRLVNAAHTPCGITPTPCDILAIQIMNGKHIRQTSVGFFRLGDD